jgi:hypothetical protein
MKLSTFKTLLDSCDTIDFIFTDGTLVPTHFHITEVGLITRKFIDCGWTMRKKHNINLQLRTSHDIDHRLTPAKLMNIIELSEKKIELWDHDIEVEYQWVTIEKYFLTYQNGTFILKPLATDCLAKDKCGIPSSPTQKKAWFLSWFSKKKTKQCCSWWNCG